MRHKRIEERIQLARELADRFRQRAEQIDRAGAFPFDNIEELKQSGYTSLTVPRKYGGQEISMLEMVRLQEVLATGEVPQRCRSVGMSVR